MFFSELGNLAWNAFGAPLVFGAAFATLRAESQEGGALNKFGDILQLPAPGVFVATVVVASIVGHALLPFHLKPDKTLQGVRGAIALLLEVILIFVASQRLSRRRHSHAHVPSEVAYVPALFALLLCLPQLVDHSLRGDKEGAREQAGEDEQGASSSSEKHSASRIQLLQVSTAICTLVSTGVVCAHVPVDGEFSKPIDSWTQVVLVVMCGILHGLPACFDVEPAKKHSTWALAASCTLRIACAVGGVVAFWSKTVTNGTGRASYSRYHYHDFFSIRATANPHDPAAEYSHAQNSTLATETLVLVISQANGDTLVQGALLKLGAFLAATQWWLLARKGMCKRLGELKIDTRLYALDIFDLECAGLFVILGLALFGASANHEAPLLHSTNILWAVLALAASMATGFLLAGLSRLQDWWSGIVHFLNLLKLIK